jgi:hypothetical protein
MLGKRFFKVMFEDSEQRIFNIVIAFMLVIAALYCLVSAVMCVLSLLDINI